MPASDDNTPASRNAEKVNAVAVPTMADVVWDTVASAEASPSFSHVEVLFGSSPKPWDGRGQRNVTYYVTSIRPDLVLMSHRSCGSLCNRDFPDCFRVGKERRCGRRFAKSPSGTRAALAHAVSVHRRSVARERSLWSVLVLYDKRGWWRRVQTWSDVSDADTLASVGDDNDTSCGLNFFDKCMTVWRVPLLVFFGLLIFALVLVLLHVITRKKKAQAVAVVVVPGDKNQSETGANNRETRTSSSSDNEAAQAPPMHLPGGMPTISAVNPADVLPLSAAAPITGT